MTPFEHHVLDEHAAALARVEVAAGLDHLAQRVALVDGHQLAAQRFVGGVQREGEAQWHVLLGERFDAGDPADGRDRGVAVPDAEIGQALAGGEHVVEVQHRLAHAHEHAVAQPPAVALHAVEVKRLVDDLRGRQVAREFHLAGGAEGARQRAARLRGEADRASTVAVAHQHGLERSPVGCREQRLDGAVARTGLVLQAQARERQLAGERVAQPGGQVGHLLIALRPACRPGPHLPRAKARLVVLGEGLLQQGEVHDW